MGINKLAVAAVFTCLAIAPAMASGPVMNSGAQLLNKDLLIPTAACSKGFSKSRKTGACVKIKIAKPKPAKGSKDPTKGTAKGRKGIVAQNGDGSI